MLKRALSNRHRELKDEKVKSNPAPSEAKSPSAPEKPLSRRRTLKTQVYRRLEPACGKPAAYVNLPEATIKPHQVKVMNHTLCLPLDTPMLTTQVAQTSKAVTRPSDTLVSRDLCQVHTWFDANLLNYFAELVAWEVHYQSANFYLHRRLLNPCTQQALEDLRKIRNLFEPQLPARVTLIKSAVDAFSHTSRHGNCTACKLGILLRDKKAVAALATLCKARKRHRRQWPELLAYLEPIETGEDNEWKCRWLKESAQVRKDRKMVRSQVTAGTLRDANVEPVAEQEAEEVAIEEDPVFSPEYYSKDPESSRCSRASTATRVDDYVCRAGVDYSEDEHEKVRRRQSSNSPSVYSQNKTPSSSRSVGRSSRADEAASRYSDNGSFESMSSGGLSRVNEHYPRALRASRR